MVQYNQIFHYIDINFNLKSYFLMKVKNIVCYQIVNQLIFQYQDVMIIVIIIQFLKNIVIKTFMVINYQNNVFKIIEFINITLMD